MASQPADPQLPLFYGSVSLLSPELQPAWGFESPQSLAFARNTHAIPITVDEFVIAQRHYPVVFGSGAGAAPIALVGMADGRNLFVDEEGNWMPGVYIPAYVRRYPFILAKRDPASTELSLCFDEASGMFGPDRGQPLFEGLEASEATKNALEFCSQFEAAVHRTRQFMQEIEGLGLVIDGEVSMQVQGRDQPIVYRGFRMVDEAKLRELRGDQARKILSNGVLGLVFAHLFSLGQVKELFELAGRQSGEA